MGQIELLQIGDKHLSVLCELFLMKEWEKGWKFIINGRAFVERRNECKKYITKT